MVLLVLAQVGDGAEPLTAEHTRAGNSGHVRLEVFAKCGATGHRRATHHARSATRPRVIARVDLLVRLQGTFLDEAFAAGLAAEGTLTGVYPLMAFQGVGLVEAFATSLAPERLLPRVYAQVALQVTWYCEAFVAVLAVIGPLSRVDHLMHFQAVGSVESLAALFTAKRPDLTVVTHVVPQQLLQGETLPTNITDMWSLTCLREQ